MSATGLALVSLAAFLAFYAAFVLALAVAGRRRDAGALARFIPDCLVLLRRLLADGRVPRSRKLALVLLLGYLASPIDLVPDFIPVVGQLDDAILAALVLRFVLRGGEASAIERHWPGPPQGARLIRRLAFGYAAGSSLNPADSARRSRRGGGGRCRSSRRGRAGPAGGAPGLRIRR